MLERSAHPDDRAVTEAIVSQLEANELAKAEAMANMTAYRITEALLGVLGLLTRR